MTSIVVTPQQDGWSPDYSESGRKRVEELTGDGVQVPFRVNDFSVTATGTGSSAFFNNDKQPLNSDGTQSNLQVNVGQITSPGISMGVRIRFYVWGTVFGIRWVRGYNNNNQDFGVLIDGVAYTISNSNLDTDSQSVTTSTFDPRAYKMLATDLPNTRHVIDLIFIGSTAGLNAWQINGYIASSKAGYRHPSPQTAITVVSPLGTSYVNALPSSYRTLSSLSYYNFSAGTATVTVQGPGSITLWSATLAAGGFAQCPLVTGIVGTNLTHKSDTASAITAIVGAGG